MAVVPADAEHVRQAAQVLREGGLVAFPTETVYGLGANALNEQAVARIFEVKGRPRFDPLIVHVANAQAASELVESFPEAAQRLAQAFWPGPLTIVLRKKFVATESQTLTFQEDKKESPGREPRASGSGDAGEPVIGDLVTAGLATVAVRVPGHPVALELIREAGVPVAAPSANRFGGISPTRAQDVEAELGEAVEFILDGGPCRMGLESTVVSLVGLEQGGWPVVLRLGGLAVEEIEEVIGPVELARTGEASQEKIEAGRLSPGMLARHYAPRTPLRMVSRADEAVSGEGLGGRRVAVLAWRDAEPLRAAVQRAGGQVVAAEVLSAAGDLREAASGLFAAMRRLDAAEADLILAERVPEEGLGRAINDRLRRAGTPAAEGGCD